MQVLAPYRGYLTVVLLNLTALGVIVWQLRDPRATAVRIEPPPTSTPAPTATAVLLHVYVSGAVETPDVVVLPMGSRARDAVVAAGGFASGADRDGVNLAARLADGQQLHVPADGEMAGPPPGVSGGSGLGADGSVGGGAAPSSGGGSVGSAGRINVNTATALELEALPGVGPALAARIVAHRQAHGPFRRPEDLLAVSGIGEKTLTRFADRVAVR